VRIDKLPPVSEGMHSIASIPALALLVGLGAASYTLQTSYPMDSTFFDEFSFFTVCAPPIAWGRGDGSSLRCGWSRVLTDVNGIRVPILPTALSSMSARPLHRTMVISRHPTVRYTSVSTTTTWPRAPVVRASDSPVPPVIHMVSSF
jgi:hypothetical protein